MISKTLFFENPAYLSLENGQIVIDLPEVENNETLPLFLKENLRKRIPIEETGVIILDNPRITITQALIRELLKNNIALITCDEKHLPTGLMLQLDGNTLQSNRYKKQQEATLPLKKQLWQQTIKAKITNQAAVLSLLGVPALNMLAWSNEVKSGDSQNHEGRAAVYYWKNFLITKDFVRKRDGLYPNNLLNYGYSIIRAMTARSLVAAGLHPTYGIFHRNQYNAYCLADDLMEPYRPFVDLLVHEIMSETSEEVLLDKQIKGRLLKIQTTDVLIENQRRPLAIAIQRTADSLYKCFDGASRKLLFPDFIESI